MNARKVVQSSNLGSGAPVEAPLDRLSALLERFRVRAHLFHSGPLCGVTPFDAQPGRAFLHVLRRGCVRVSHPRLPRPRRELTVDRPSLLLYARATPHVFHNPPREGSDFTCAALDFDGGERHPIVAALPDLVLLPLDAVPGLGSTLDLLFAETDRVRCGSRLLADRLFEVLLIQVLRWMLDHPREAGVTTGLIAGMADPRLARALVALHADPGRAWSVAQMAQQAGMSRAAFAAAFKAATAATPGEYLADWRIGVALAALRAGEPLKAVAPRVGYASAAALSRLFRERLGASPRRLLAPERGPG